jgi:hypothetical protein
MRSRLEALATASPSRCRCSVKATSLVYRAPGTVTVNVDVALLTPMPEPVNVTV